MLFMYVIIYLISCLFMWLIGYILFDKYGNTNPKVSFILKWYDGWIGFFWDKNKRWLYVFPIPFFGIVIKPFRKDFV